jgi:hypothetical protein
MPAQVLRVCSACGRPQFPSGAACVVCGAALPEVLEPAPKSARDQLLGQYEPFLEADFGRGHVFLLSPKQLEWRVSGARRLAADLAQVATVQLRTRPVWEALLPVGVLLALSFWSFPTGVRATLWAVAALWSVAGLVQRRCALAVSMKDGRHASLFIGTGNPVTRHAQSVWATVGPELARVGVRVDGG